MKNNGALLEKQIGIICTKYAGNGSMRIKKVEQPIKTFGSRVIHLENPFLDYVGTWTERNGRAIFFEVKHTEKQRLPLGGGGLTANQRDAMRLWENSGAVVFLLWECGGACKMFRRDMVEFYATQARSLQFKDGVDVPAGQGWVLWDFRLLMLKLWA